LDQESELAERLSLVGLRLVVHLEDDDLCLEEGDGDAEVDAADPDRCLLWSSQADSNQTEGDLEDGGGEARLLRIVRFNDGSGYGALSGVPLDVCLDAMRLIEEEASALIVGKFRADTAGKVARIEDANACLAEQVVSCERLSALLDGSLAERKAENGESVRRLKDLRSDNLAIARDIDAAKAEGELLAEDLGEHRTHVATLKARMKSALSQATRELASLRQELGKASADVERAVAAREAARRDHRAALEETDRLRADLERLSAEVPIAVSKKTEMQAAASAEEDAAAAEEVEIAKRSLRVRQEALMQYRAGIEAVDTMMHMERMRWASTCQRAAQVFSPHGSTASHGGFGIRGVFGIRGPASRGCGSGSRKTVITASPAFSAFVPGGDFSAHVYPFHHPIVMQQPQQQPQQQQNACPPFLRSPPPPPPPPVRPNFCHAPMARVEEVVV
jgi:hypothetical protein